MDILQQLGGLFLAAVPTVILVTLFYLFLRWSFFGPIERVLAQREARTAGARRAAESLREAAEEQRRAHRDALHKARTEIFREQEAARQAALEKRAEVLQQARNRANEEIAAAKKGLYQEIEAARSELDVTGEQLAEAIVRVIGGERPLNPIPASKIQ
jgi:F-type H+-transporting ATPase subunit b